MAVRKSAGNQSKAGDTEAKVVALAEQLGWFLGTVQARASGWLNRAKLRQEVVGIRDAAAELLQHFDAASRSAGLESARPKATPQPVAKPAESATLAVKPSRGLVDAPGKRHRKPPPQERLDKRMGEPVGKQMGQKSFQVGKSRGRG